MHLTINLASSHRDTDWHTALQDSTSPQITFPSQICPFFSLHMLGKLSTCLAENPEPSSSAVLTPRLLCRPVVWPAVSSSIPIRLPLVWTCHLPSGKSHFKRQICSSEYPGQVFLLPFLHIFDMEPKFHFTLRQRRAWCWGQEKDAWKRYPPEERPGQGLRAKKRSSPSTESRLPDGHLSLCGDVLGKQD